MREKWMHWVPGSKYYYCKECNTDCISVGGMFTLSVTVSAMHQNHYRSGIKRRSDIDRRKKKRAYRRTDRRLGDERRKQEDRRQHIFNHHH